MLNQKSLQSQEGMRSSLSVPNVEDLTELSSEEISSWLAGGYGLPFSLQKKGTEETKRSSVGHTVPRKGDDSVGSASSFSGTTASGGDAKRVANHVPPSLSTPLPPGTAGNEESDKAEEGVGLRAAMTGPHGRIPTEGASDTDLLPPALSDAQLLQAERNCALRQLQEAWLYRSERHQCWNAELRRLGTGYRAHPIAARTALTRSHTKGLCISLNMDPTFQCEPDDYAYEEGGVPLQDGPAAELGDTGDGAENRMLPLFMWQSPTYIAGDAWSILKQLGEDLEAQYMSLAPRASAALPTTFCHNPRLTDLGQALSESRGEAGDAKVIFHYYARGVPPPRGGCIYLMNDDPTASGDGSFETKMSLKTFRAQVGFPLVFVADCDEPGEILKDFLRSKKQSLSAASPFSPRERQFASSRDASSVKLDALGETVDTGFPLTARDAALASAASVGGGDSPGLLGTPPLYDNFYFIGASGPGGRLPKHERLPSDILTSCLTTPVRMAVLWYMIKHPALRELHPALLHVLPGALSDKKTPLGQLQWYFQTVMECIAWATLPLPLYSRLFCEDIYVAPLFRGCLLAERIITGGLGGTVHVYPPLASTHNHPFWGTWEFFLERAMITVLRLVQPAPPASCSTLEFREWLDVRLTNWRYEQQTSSPLPTAVESTVEGGRLYANPGGTAVEASQRLPTIVDPGAVLFPSFLEEELRSVEALVDSITQQSFIPPSTVPTAMDATGGAGVEQGMMSPSYGSHGRASTLPGPPPPPTAATVGQVRADSAAGGGESWPGETMRRVYSARRGLENLTSSPGPEGEGGTAAAVAVAAANGSAYHPQGGLGASGGGVAAGPGVVGMGRGVKEEYINNAYATTNASATSAVFPFIERMPIVLQGLLVLAHREKATELVCRLVDVGAPAVQQCAEANLYSMVLDRYWSRGDLRYLIPATLFIYCKSCYADPTLVGPARQRNVVIKTCLEVIQCPVEVPGGTAGERGGSPEAGAWQRDVLGAYATPTGQRLLAAALLAQVCMSSDEARTSCHQMGAFQLCCQLLGQLFVRAPPLDHAHLGKQCDSGGGGGVGTRRGSSATSFLSLVGMTPEDDELSTYYAMSVVALFIALLHAWAPPAPATTAEDDEGDDADGREDEDGDDGEYGGDEGEAEAVLKEAMSAPLDSDTVVELLPSSQRVVKVGLAVARGTLERMMYAENNALRGVAVKALTMVLMAPAPSLTTRTRYATALLVRLYRERIPPYEGSTDVRLEVVGSGYLVYKWLLEKVRMEMTAEDLQSAMMGWWFRWWKKAQRGKPPHAPHFDDSGSDADEGDSTGDGADDHSDDDGREDSFNPFGLNSGQPLLSTSIQPWRGPSTLRYSRSVVGRGTLQHSMSTSALWQSPAVPGQPRRMSDLQRHVALLSNLMRVLMECTQSTCPYVAAHAKAIAVEEFRFLPAFVSAPPTEYGRSPNDGVLEPASRQHHRSRLGIPSASTMHRRQSPSRGGHHPRRAGGWGSHSPARGESEEQKHQDTLFRAYLTQLLRHAWPHHRMGGDAGDSSAAGGHGGARGDEGWARVTEDDDDAGRHAGGGVETIAPGRGLAPLESRRGGMPAHRVLMRDGVGGVRNGAVHAASDDGGHHSSRPSAVPHLTSESVCLPALSSQDSSTVSAAVYTALGFLADLLLVPLDDHDERHPFHLRKEDALYAYMGRVGSSLRRTAAVDSVVRAELSTPTTLSPSHATPTTVSAAARSLTTASSSRPEGGSTTALLGLCGEWAWAVPGGGARPPSQPFSSSAPVPGVVASLPPQMLLHPSKPHLVLVSAQGLVQVWEYTPGTYQITRLAAGYDIGEVVRTSLATTGDTMVQLRYPFSLFSSKAYDDVATTTGEDEAADAVGEEDDVLVEWNGVEEEEETWGRRRIGVPSAITPFSSSSSASASYYHQHPHHHHAGELPPQHPMDTMASRGGGGGGGAGGMTGGGHQALPPPRVQRRPARHTPSDVVGLHLLDPAGRTSLLSVVRRGGGVEVVSGYASNATVRRVTSFETVEMGLSAPKTTCQSSYQALCGQLYLSRGITSVAVWDLSCAMRVCTVPLGLTQAGVTEGDGEVAMDITALTVHASRPSQFAVGAESVYLYDTRQASAGYCTTFSSRAVVALASPVVSSTEHHSVQWTASSSSSLPLRCVHCSYSHRYPHLLVAGYDDAQATVLLWDDRMAARPVYTYASLPPPGKEAAEGGEGWGTPQFVQVQSSSRGLCTVAATPTACAYVEAAPQPRSAALIMPPSPWAATAATFHPFEPLLAVHFEDRLRLYRRRGSSVAP